MLHELVIHIPYEKADDIVTLFQMEGIIHLYYEEPIEVVRDENGYGYVTRDASNVELKLYAEEQEDLDTYFDAIKKITNVDRDQVEHSVWKEEQWQEGGLFEDIDLGNGWFISYPDFKEVPGKKPLKLDPQAAFGTGLHETTQDCLRLILKEDFKGKTVLDLGAGSGVLSIAAAIRGASEVKAIDLEPVEREINHQARLNGVSNVDVHQADLLEGSYRIGEKVDWIFINIGADETLHILERHRLLEKADDFLISGLVDWNVGRILQKFEDAGYDLKEKRQTNEWLTAHFMKAQKRIL